MMSKEQKRVRRAGRIRRRIGPLVVERLSVHRTPQHIYAQIVDKSGARVLASASTLDKEVRASIKHGGNIDAAKLIGQRIAEKAKAAGVTRVAFDRAGYQYHGRVKALADAAREHGLQF
jgi:large subunit ribosomal protein L18